MKEGAEMSIYRTNVRFGVSLQNGAKSVSSLNTRYLLNDLNKYLYSDLSVNTPYYGKVCALYGLRRTGKTTMMLQSILGMTNEQFNKTAWIDVTEEDNMASLYLDLQKLNEQGYKYIFIDEITKVEQFVRVSSLLSDEFAISGIHIVLTGTDSAKEESCLIVQFQFIQLIFHIMNIRIYFQMPLLKIILWKVDCCQKVELTIIEMKILKNMLIQLLQKIFNIPCLN